jgi:hypothetical protein
MKEKLTEAELRAAYEICIIVKHHCDNVLASEGFENSSSDKEWSRKATKFIKAYEKVNAANLAKAGKAGSMGRALLLLNKMSSTITEIEKTL